MASEISPPSGGMGGWLRMAFAGLIVASIYAGWHFYSRNSTLQEISATCIRAESRGRWADLEIAARRWIDLVPSSDEARFFLGKAVARKSRLTKEAAEESLRSLELVSPESTRAQEATELRLGLLFGAANQPVLAAEEIEGALKRFPESGPMRLMYCNYLLMTLDRQALIEQIHESCRTRSDVPVIYGYLSVADTAFIKDRTTVVQQWYDGSPEDAVLKDAVLLSNLLDARVKLVGNISDETQKTVDEAMASVTRRLKAGPPSPQVVREMIEARIEAGDIKGVSELLQMATDSSINDPFFWRASGWYRMMVEEFEAAEQDLTKARRLFPTSWKTHNELASLYRRMGRLSEAGKMQELADQGRELDGRIREMDRIADLDKAFLERLFKYVSACKDETVEEALRRRLDK